MNKTQVQMEIAKLLGYTVGEYPVSPERTWMVLFRPNGTVFKGAYYFPTWPVNDTKAEEYLLAYAGDWCENMSEAMRLCQKIAWILDCIIVFDQVHYSDDGETEVSFASTWYNDGAGTVMELGQEASDMDVTFALAKLALKTLRTLSTNSIAKLNEDD